MIEKNNHNSVNKFIIKEVNYMGLSTEELLDKVLQFKDKTLIFFDTETMGIDPHREYSQLLQLGIIVVNGNDMSEIESHNIKIKLTDTIKKLFKSDSPERLEWDKRIREKSYKTPSQILSMTGYFKEGSFENMDEVGALNLFSDIINKYKDPILIAHNATFDMKFTNTRALLNNIQIKKVPVIDSLRISQLYFVPILQSIKSKLLSDLKLSKTMKISDIAPKDKSKKKKVQKDTEFEHGTDPKSGEEILTIRYGHPSSSLGKLSVALFKDIDNWHSALADTKTLINVFKKIIEYLNTYKTLDIRKNKEDEYMLIKKRNEKYKKMKESLNEKLILKKYTPKNLLVVVSDNEDSKSRSAETFKHREALKKYGFKWDTLINPTTKNQINAWTISSSESDKAREAISLINKEKGIHSQIPEEFEDFIIDLADISKKSQLDTKIVNFLEKLSSDVDQVHASEEYIKYINFSKKFTSYSTSNRMLIYIQKRNATRVAGFNAWKKLNRKIKAGATAIQIFVPLIFNKSASSFNKDGNEHINDSKLDNLVDDNKVLTGFKVGNVFDISDTEVIPGMEDKASAAEYSWHADNTSSEKIDQIIKNTEDIINTLGLEYTSDSGEGEVGFARGGTHINISSGVAGANKASALIHELAHILLHFKNSLFYKEDEHSDSKNVKEYQAEAVAASVMDEYGIPYDHSSRYIALWNNDSDVKKFNKYSDIIVKVASYIINEIDKRVEAEEKKDEENKILEVRKYIGNLSDPKAAEFLKTAKKIVKSGDKTKKAVPESGVEYDLLPYYDRAIYDTFIKDSFNGTTMDMYITQLSLHMGGDEEYVENIRALNDDIANLSMLYGIYLRNKYNEDGSLNIPMKFDTYAAMKMHSDKKIQISKDLFDINPINPDLNESNALNNTISMLSDYLKNIKVIRTVLLTIDKVKREKVDEFVKSNTSMVEFINNKLKK